MRFLHTSDWHLGRTFHGADVLDVQARAMEEIVAWVVEHHVDAVLVAGDVYDRAQPRTDVVDLLNSTLARIRAAGAYVVMTSGNHDSATRLGFGATIMSHGGVFLRTRWEQATRPVLFRSTPEGVRVEDTALAGHRTPLVPAADVGGHTVAVYGIPYLEPRSAAPLLDCPATHQAVLESVVHAAVQDRANRSVEHAVIMAHAFVTGAAATDSERVVDSGGLGTVSADVFEPWDYAALGHIHRRQRIRENTRYSGSPVAYSFSETGQDKGAWLVEVPEQGPQQVTALHHRAGLDLARLRGDLEDLLQDPNHRDAQGAWCQVVLTDEQRPAAAMDRIRTRFPRTVELRWEPIGARVAPARTYSSRVATAQNPEHLCEQFYEHVRRRAATEAELTDIGTAVAAAQSSHHTA